MRLVVMPMLLAIEDLRGPIVSSYLNRFFPSSYKTTLFSINSAVGATGEIVAGLLFGVLAAEFGLPFTFLVAGACLLPAIAMYMLAPRLKAGEVTRARVPPED